MYALSSETTKRKKELVDRKRENTPCRKESLYFLFKKSVKYIDSRTTQSLMKSMDGKTAKGISYTKQAIVMPDSADYNNKVWNNRDLHVAFAGFGTTPRETKYTHRYVLYAVLLFSLFYFHS